MLFCADSVSASRLTTLIVAGCENVTDTSLLICFLPTVSKEMKLSSSSPVSSVRDSQPPAAAGSCWTANNWTAVASQSSYRKLKSSDGSESLQRHCAASMCGMEPCSSVASQNRSIDCSGYCPDTTALPPVIADHSVADQGSDRGCQSEVKQSVANYCTRVTSSNDNSTCRSHKLEHLDVSGCWRITDLSVRFV